MSYSAILPCIHNDSDLVNIYNIVCMLWNIYIYIYIYIGQKLKISTFIMSSQFMI